MQGIRYPEDKADEAYLVKSHAILWVYATHQEGALLPEDPYRGDGAKRAYLIGSSPVELLPLLSDLSHQRDHVVECMHNFSGTKARCTFHCSTPDAARASHALLSSMLQDGRAVPSVMGQLDSVQRLVHLQQGLVRAYCLDQMQKGHMTLADEMGPQLLSIGTFMQLYGASVCFSDVSAIVRQRVVEFPFELVMVFAFAAMNGLCLDPARFALSASAADKTRFFKVHCRPPCAHVSGPYAR